VEETNGTDPIGRSFVLEDGSTLVDLLLKVRCESLIRTGTRQCSLSAGGILKRKGASRESMKEEDEHRSILQR
jgi:hypothetical protein